MSDIGREERIALIRADIADIEKLAAKGFEGVALRLCIGVLKEDVVFLLDERDRLVVEHDQQLIAPEADTQKIMDTAFDRVEQENRQRVLADCLIALVRAQVQGRLECRLWRCAVCLYWPDVEAVIRKLVGGPLPDAPKEQ